MRRHDGTHATAKFGQIRLCKIVLDCLTQRRSVRRIEGSGYGGATQRAQLFGLFETKPYSVSNFFLFSLLSP
jgi:hypothetical protein